MLSRVNHVSYAIDNLRRAPILMDDLRTVLALPEVIVQGLMEGELKRAANHAVLFFNTFTPEAGRELFLLLADERIHPQAKSLLKALGLWEGGCDQEFYNKLVKELSQ